MIERWADKRGRISRVRTDFSPPSSCGPFFCSNHVQLPGWMLPKWEGEMKLTWQWEVVPARLCRTVATLLQLMSGEGNQCTGAQMSTAMVAFFWGQTGENRIGALKKIIYFHFRARLPKRGVPFRYPRRLHNKLCGIFDIGESGWKPNAGTSRN